MRALYWVRDDLRAHDNLARQGFLKHAGPKTAIYVPSKYFHRASSFRQQFLQQSLEEFSSSLPVPLERSADSIENVLSSEWEKAPFTHLYFTHAFAAEETQDEKLVLNFCQRHGIEVKGFEQTTLIHPEDLPFPLEKMPFVFTDFRKKVESHLKIRDCERVELPSLSMQEFRGGEVAALARLRHYLWETSAIRSYQDTRNGMILWDDSTKFSPWLAVGCLSPRLIYQELRAHEERFGANDSTYWLLFELLWRDYFKFFSRKFGAKIFQLQGVRPSAHQPQRNLELYANWCRGETEDEFVNCNMRELNQTGWMSNRGRQNVASYLIHDLNLPWTWGARYFEEKLIDYDPDQNWGNWLYLSGRGSDPRSRRFNTTKQAETYDPHGEYRRLWART